LRDGKKRECVLPEGKIIVWKLATALEKENYVYVQLEVNDDVKRVTPMSSLYFKSRVEKAKVLSIVDDAGNNYSQARSCVLHASLLKPFLYVVGKEVIPDSFDSDPNNECSHGINVHLYKDQCDVWKRC
jgi:hypothetical protein